MERNDLVSIRTDEGVRCALVVAVGHKYVSLLWADDRKPGVRVHKVSHRDAMHVTPLLFREKPYPLSRAKRHWRRMARQFGATKAAQQALRS